jgi:DNA-binding MarR family transcriptional regulator
MPVVAELVPAEGLAAWRAFLEAHAAVVGRIQAELEAGGHVPLAWYDVLLAISEAPGRRIRLRDLARRLVLTRSGATRLVDRLAAAGLVDRERVDEDRRGAAAVLTLEGARALRRAWPRYADAINRLFVSALTPEEAATIRTALERVTNALRADR